MRTSLRRVLPLVALVSLLGVASPTSAESLADACTGSYAMQLSNGFGLPAVTSNSAGFSLVMTTGTCVVKGLNGLTMTGVVTGACGLAFGSGTTGNGYHFEFEWYTTLIVFTGGVTGSLGIYENGADAGTCTNVTATSFTLTGSFAKIDE